MNSPLENFFLDQQEPNKSTFLALRHIILSINPDIAEGWKYRLPFFETKGKMLCYLWQDNKTKEPYVGIVKGHLIEHEALVKGNRKQIKIIRVNPNEDIDQNTIIEIIKSALEHY